MAKHTGFEKLVADARKNITEISPHDAAAKLKSGEAVMIDVRDKDEWEEGHIPGATHAMIICHCGPEGFRGSALAAESLQRMGYKNVRSMAGGFKAWKVAGLPTTK